MKKLKIVLIVFAGLILLLVVAAVIFLMSFDINRYKAQIVSQASATLGREVDFEKAKLTISLNQGVSIKINNLRIAENPAFGKDDFLVVKEASLGIDVKGLIFNKKLDVSGILIDSPRIRIIREKDGSLNVGNLAEAGKKEQAPAAKTATASSPAASPALLISSLRITDGNLVYVDRALDPALSVEINQMSLEAAKISLDSSFPIVCEAAVLSNQKNVRMEAKVKPDPEKNTLFISGLKVNLELSRIKPEKLREYFPMLKGVSLPTDLRGQVQISLTDFIVGGKEPPVFFVEVSSRGSSLKFKELASPIEGMSLYGELNRHNLNLDDFLVTIGRGKVKASGAIEDYLSSQEYTVKAAVDELMLQEVIVQDKSEVQIEGIVSGLLELTGQGLTPQDFQTKLNGRGELNVVKPRLKNINVLRTVLDKIGAISGLSEQLEANLPERYKQKLTQKDTVLSDINLPVTISNGRLTMQQIVLEAEEFRFEGWGNVGFDGAFVLEGAFLIPHDLSQAMVAAASQLEYLLSTGNQIYIPLRVSGNAARFEFNVDAAYIASKLLAEQGRKQLLKVLDKALGAEETGQEQQEGLPQEQDPQQREPTTEDAVKGLLQEIFR